MKKIISVLLPFAMLLAAFLPYGAFAEEPIYFGPFAAENVRGEGEVTEAIFAEAEITIVNFWATWCPPCVAELPYLSGLSEATDGRAQVIGVLLDGATMNNKGEFVRDQTAIDAMHALLDNCGATFAVILAEDPLLASLASIIEYVPTSFIIGSDAKILDFVVGSRSASQWMELVEKYAE